jgi:hypothetical protein
MLACGNRNGHKADGISGSCENGSLNIPSPGTQAPGANNGHTASQIRSSPYRPTSSAKRGSCRMGSRRGWTRR